MGLIITLSGPAAPWGMQTEQGVEWAISGINAAGGVKAGADTYMVKLVKCDDKWIASEGATCATKMVYDEKVHYVVGPINALDALNPIMTAGKCFMGGITNADKEFTNPDAPYTWITLQGYDQWVDTFWKQLSKVETDIKTVGLIAPITSYDQMTPSKAAVLKYFPGVEIVEAVTWVQGITDFYPLLTPIVAKNPDAIGMTDGGVGDQSLMIKQVRELGFKGILVGSNFGDPGPGAAVAGNAAIEGFYQNEPDYSSDIYPQTTRALYAEYQNLYPGAQFGLCQYLGYSAVYFYKQAIEKAGSIDPDKVKTVLDDPNWTYEWFGMPGRSLGGLSTYGIKRTNQDEVCLSTTHDGKKVAISHEQVIVP
jgi:branched-chain amino acid transport system substrate-binding protein